MNVLDLQYPQTQKENSNFFYFGHRVDDPYHWLENSENIDVLTWRKEQDQLTNAYLNSLPQREELKKRLENLWNVEKRNGFFKRGSYIYFNKIDINSGQTILCRVSDFSDFEVVFDPNETYPDGSRTLADISSTVDGSLIACVITNYGTDDCLIRVVDTETMEVLDDIIENVKFSFVSWMKNDGFFYSSYVDPVRGEALRYHGLYYHKLGTPCIEDKLIFGGEAERRSFVMGYVIENSNFLVIGSAMDTSGNDLYLKDLSNDSNELKCIIDHFDSQCRVLRCTDEKLIIYTNLNAPCFRIVSTELSSPTANHWQDLVGESQVPMTVSVAGDHLFVQTIKEENIVINQINLNGDLLNVKKFSSDFLVEWGASEPNSTSLFYTLSSPIHPPVVYCYDTETRNEIEYWRCNIEFDGNEYRTYKVFSYSLDGTRIPMMISHRKDLELNGSNPTILTSYGGFGISMKPEFNISNIVLLEKGGIVAVPNIRGGGEFGTKWHEGGMRLNKQNVFDDFIASANYLFNHGFTSPEFLGIAGASNGGLLVTTVATQKPDLCRIIFADVAVTDMLRYHVLPAGLAWKREYGFAEESEEVFSYLLNYSPYHNIKAAHYPAILITTGDRDDRVSPIHSFKFCARVQENQIAQNPVLLRVLKDNGHGMGKSVLQIVEEQADKWAFFFHNISREK